MMIKPCGHCECFDSLFGRCVAKCDAKAAFSAPLMYRCNCFDIYCFLFVFMKVFNILKNKHIFLKTQFEAFCGFLVICLLIKNKTKFEFIIVIIKS